MCHRSVIVFPDDTAASIIAAIDAWVSALRIQTFLFSATVIIEAVIRARERGVKVKVMLNPARRNGEEENEVTSYWKKQALK